MLKLKAENNLLIQMGSTVSHELLTPIKCMISILDNIRSSPNIPKENQEDLKIVSNTAQFVTA